MSTTLDGTITVSPLARDDLDAVVAIDAALQGRARRRYVERRLAAALREPTLHAQFAARDASGLLGYMLARGLEGEFGRTEPGLRLEMVGVRSDARGRGAGRKLFDALSAWAGRHQFQDIRTTADWRDTGMLRWLDALGFELAPDHVLARNVADAQREREPDDNLVLPQRAGPGNEIDFGAPEDNDFERLERGRCDVRTMMPADLREIVRIDRSITGRDRGRYIDARLAEAMGDSGLRVSLTARLDDAIVGYLMARADLGDFGRTEPVAVIDTLGVDPDYGHRGVAHAMLAHLFGQLGALQIERAETVVVPSNLALLGFFQDAGFKPSSRLAFVRALR